MSDTGERSEKATDKRMREAHSKGRLSRSTDLSAWLAIAAAAIMLPGAIGKGSSAAVDQLFLVRQAIAHPSLAIARAALADGLASVGATVGGVLGLTAAVALGASVVQGGVHVRRIVSFEHLDLAKGVGRLFGPQAAMQGVKALIKTAVVGLVLWMAVKGLLPIVYGSGRLPVASILSAAGDGAATLLRFAIAAGLAVAGFDVVMVIRRNRKHTRMTKREVKDEHKSSEGDPHIKGQRRSRQLAMSRNRMIGAIAGADVVLANPTHFVVALKYEPGRSAPRVVAKGAGQVAQRLREQAATDRVPVVTDIPLTRALHAACDLGDEIPADLYTPVARVLSFVMALKARGAGAGTHRAPRPTTAAEVSAVIGAESLTGDALPRRIRTPKGATEATPDGAAGPTGSSGSSGSRAAAGASRAPAGAASRAGAAPRAAAAARHAAGATAGPATPPATTGAAL